MARVEVRRVEPVFRDERGTIADILEGEVRHTGIIWTKKGAFRGGHYHRKSIQYTYILKGRMEMKTKNLAKDKSRVKTTMIEKGDLITIPPMFAHSFVALEETTFLDMTTESRADGGYENDTFRLKF